MRAIRNTMFVLGILGLLIAGQPVSGATGSVEVPGAQSHGAQPFKLRATRYSHPEIITVDGAQIARPLKAEDPLVRQISALKSKIKAVHGLHYMVAGHGNPM